MPTVVNDPSGAVINVYDFGPMVLHAFVNPPEGFGTATYIVEGANNLVLIDSHYSAAPAHAFRSYADSLGKPLARIYVTHEHPDHTNGLRDAFADVKSYAGPETARLVAGSGIEIDHIVSSGSEVFDGLTYQFERYSGAESAESLVIMLPEFGIVATGDLVYNQYHMVLNRNLDPWIDVLEELQRAGDHTLILPGHGQPDTPEVYAENLDYLRTASRLYDEIGDQNAFSAAMAEMFPDHSVLAFLRLGAGRMFPKK